MHPPPSNLNLRSFFSFASLFFCSLIGAGPAVGFAADAPAAEKFPAPRTWEAGAFLPLTAERIAALPAAEQPAWRKYWETSIERLHRQPAHDAPEYSPMQPVTVGPGGAAHSRGVRLDAPAAWYASEEARAIADHIVEWQTPAGGWTKSGDYTRKPEAADDHHDVWNMGTFDNDATIFELRYLALVVTAAGENERARSWRESFQRGFEYTLAAQYPNGGFPQIYPLGGSYHDAITFNDDAMVHILEFLRDIGAPRAPFLFVSPASAALAREREKLGVACVLATQMKSADGRLTVWGQQHDPLTLKPCAARNFEPISACAAESASLVQFLMTVPEPSKEMIAAIEGAMAWLNQRALHGVAWDRSATTGSGLIARPGASGLWARFYEIDTNRPVFGDRDRTIHYTVTEVSLERRKGYSWYNSRPANLGAIYSAWKKRLATH